MKIETTLRRHLPQSITETSFRSVVIVLVLLSSGCVKISGSITNLLGQNDFLKTEFIVGGPQPADGVSQLLVGLQLKNSDNRSVPGYKPAYQVVSGSGVITSACTTSDANGISACIIKSVQSGQKTLELTNAKVGLRQNVLFENPHGSKTTNIISGAEFHRSTTLGSKVSASLGNATQGIKRTTTAGYIVNFSLHGSVSAQ
jgi:hypothetical protein